MSTAIDSASSLGGASGLGDGRRLGQLVSIKNVLLTKKKKKKGETRAKDAKDKATTRAIALAAQYALTYI